MLGIGFGQQEMPGTYAIIWSLSFNTQLQEYILGDDQAGTMVNDTAKLISSTINIHNIHTIIIEKNNSASSVYTFSESLTSIYVILAKGHNEYFDGITKHKTREAQYITFGNTQYIIPNRSNVSCDSGIEYCHIYCHGDDSCHFFTIYAAKNVKNLYIDCIGIESCARTDIIPPLNGSLYINCDKNTSLNTNYQACDYMEIKNTKFINDISIICQNEEIVIF